MEKWEYAFFQLSYVEYEKMPRNWKLYHVHANGEVSTVLSDVADELNALGDEGWEIVGVVPGGPMMPTKVGDDGKPLAPGIPGVPVGPRSGGLLMLKRRKQ